MKHFRTLAIAAMVLSLAGGSISAWAKTDAEIEESIQTVLELRHPTDTPDWWRALGPGAPRVIVAMYEKTSHIYHRLRLIQALSWFDDPVATEFLKRQGHDSADDVIRNATIRSVGLSQGAKEIDHIAGFLSSTDPQARFTAAETLKKIQDPRASALLEKFMKDEKVPWILTKLKGELPKPKGALTPVASSEDRLSGEFAGQWSGYWIAPKENGGMTSIPVRLQLKVDSIANELKGELILREGPKRLARSLSVRRATGKGKSISGALSETAGGPAPGAAAVPPAQYPFDAELLHENGGYFIHLHSPKSAVTLVVRKENP